jgi:tRNA (guanine-N7-)-methyltransferase
VTAVFRPALIWCAGRERRFGDVAIPLDLDALLPGKTPWEVEIGFGKGRRLLDRAGGEPERRFLGIEVASDYYRRVATRAIRRGLGNLVLLRGEAIYLLAVALPVHFAGSVRIDFPDPWPKSRHQKRRLLSRATVDLVLRCLVPGGELVFATDHLEYADDVAAVLASYPGVVLERREPSAGAVASHYERRFESEGKEIRRLRAWLPEGAGQRPHPSGLYDLTTAPRLAAGRADDDEQHG